MSLFQERGRKKNVPNMDMDFGEADYFLKAVLKLAKNIGDSFHIKVI